MQHPTPTTLHPYAIIYPNGCELFLPIYNQAFTRRLKRLVPPKARAKMPGAIASYLIVAPWHTEAVALAVVCFPDFTSRETEEPYTPPGVERIRPLQQRGNQPKRGAA